MNYLGVPPSPFTSEFAAIDKVLAKSSMRKLEALIRKTELSREDIENLLYMLTSDELKLSKLSERDRYILGKLFAWMRDFGQLAIMVYNLLDIEKDPKNIDMLKKLKKNIDDILKEMMSAYLFLMRSTLSLEGIAFDRLSVPGQRIEYIYPYQQEMPEKPKPYLWLFRK
jgi:hypothetical protein